MTISENIQELEQELIRANARVQIIERKISFRAKGQRGRFMAEFNKAKKHRDLIASDIKRIEAKPMFEETDAFIKKERIREEKERVLDLFNEYKENPVITIPIKTQKEKPDFCSIGNRTIDRNKEVLKQAQKEFDLVKQQSLNRSPVGKGVRAGTETL